MDYRGRDHKRQTRAVYKWPFVVGQSSGRRLSLRPTGYSPALSVSTAPLQLQLPLMAIYKCCVFNVRTVTVCYCGLCWIWAFVADRVFAVAIELLSNEHRTDGERQNAFRVCDAQTPLLFLTTRTSSTRAQSPRWTVDNQLITGPRAPAASDTLNVRWGQRRTAPPPSGNLAPAEWAGWSAGQMGRHFSPTGLLWSTASQRRIQQKADNVSIMVMGWDPLAASGSQRSKSLQHKRTRAAYCKDRSKTVSGFCVYSLNVILSVL